MSLGDGRLDAIKREMGLPLPEPAPMPKDDPIEDEDVLPELEVYERPKTWTSAERNDLMGKKIFSKMNNSQVETWTLEMEIKFV